MQERITQQAMICLAISLVMTGILVFSPRVHLGFFGYVWALLLGTLFPWVGVVIGDAFRRFVRPDVLMTNGALALFRERVFWTIGPQCIGWLIGYMVFDTVMSKYLGYYF